MGLAQPEHKFVPQYLKLLLAPGMRTHTFVFAVLTLVLVCTGLLGKAAGFSETWAMVFLAGATLAFTYLVLAPAVLFEKVRGYLLHSSVKTRILVISIVYAPILSALSLWVWQAGSVEALPIFPVFIGVFYAWIFLQAYFVASPVTNALERVEEMLSGDRLAKRVVRVLGLGILFVPIVPLVFGVWAISSWLTVSFQGIQDAGSKILLWTIGMIAALVVTFFFVVSWSWPVIRRGRPQVAVFTGGTFAVAWAYLLYRATGLVIGYVSQGQAENALLDIALMVVSILGAMQTFARKTLGKTDVRWSKVFPFIVFAFGSIYAVGQLYFIVQIPVTRIELSIIINASVFVTGLATMLLFIRRHLSASLRLSPQA